MAGITFLSIHLNLNLKSMKYWSAAALTFFSILNVFAQQPVKNDSNTPLHMLQPEYKVPYNPPAKPEDVKKAIDRVRDYLEAVTPPTLINSKTGAAITDFSKPVQEAILKPGDFRLLSYEWGVTYGGMLLAGE